MTILIAVWTLTVVLAAAGTAAIVLLARSGGRSWHPGDPLPHVPPDAPLRTWHDDAQRTRVARTTPAAHHQAVDRRTRVAGTSPTAR
jgi:hypothetical protein